MQAWGGIASLQLGLPAVWSEARRRGATLSTLARWMSERPAEFAGFRASKGRVARGFDADFVVWDPDRSFTVTPQSLFFRHPVSPYLGRELFGAVRETWLRGQRIFSSRGHAPRASGQLLLERAEQA
jgi:allantoinase